MNEKRIKFVVKKNGGGAFNVETEGFTGSSCEAAVDDIIVAVGGNITKSGDKDERFLTNDPNVIVDAIR